MEKDEILTNNEQNKKAAYTSDEDLSGISSGIKFPTRKQKPKSQSNSGMYAKTAYGGPRLFDNDISRQTKESYASFLRKMMEKETDNQVNFEQELSDTQVGEDK